MRTMRHQDFRAKSKRYSRWLRLGLIGTGVLVGVFILGNLVMWVLYQDKILPNYSVAAVPVGNIKFDQLDERVAPESLLPRTLQLTKDDKKHEVTPKDLGVSIDWPTTREALKRTRSWLPVASLFTKHSVPAELRLDNEHFGNKIKELELHFTKAPLPERITFGGENFVISAPGAGYQLDVTLLKSQLIGSLEQGEATLLVPTKPTNATEPLGTLGKELESLQRKLIAKITFVNGANTRQLGRADIGRFYESTGQTMQLSAAQIGQVVADVAKGFGLTAINQNDAISAAQYAILKSQPVTFGLAAQHTNVYRYCTAVKGGVSASVLPEYRQKLAAVYGDPRGWNQGGATLVYAESGCDFTAWLSAPSSMTSFGSICDSYYSCRVGSNVIVNYDRWMGATDPWNAAGGSLEDYRVMVINHETGHWFGFGHRNCTGAGQPAPVMQQQSISLQGCTFNPWPTAPEIATLKASLGVAITHDRKYDYALASAPCACGHCTG